MTTSEFYISQATTFLDQQICAFEFLPSQPIILNLFQDLKLFSSIS